MKKILSIILALAVVLCALPFSAVTVSAESEYTSGYYTYTVSNGEATIIDYNFYGYRDENIPSSLDGYPVTSIGDYAFNGCGSPKITIPDSVTSIGDYAFSRCRSLYSLKIGNNVTSIGSNAFSECIHLANVIIPESVVSIGSYAFYACDSLYSFQIDGNVTLIDDGAFYGCDSLTTVTIIGSVTSIGTDVFVNCGSLENVYITNLAAWCDMNFVFSHSNPLYYAENFYINGTLTTDITIPDGVKNIKNYAFYNCTSLTSVTIPDSVTSIGSSAFYNCSSLTSITIPDSVTSIGNYAFYGCDSFESITLPFVGGNIDGTSNTYFGYIFGASSYSTNSSYVPSSLKEVIITKAETIGNNAFYNCSNIAKITIPDCVKSIGYNAFYGTVYFNNTDSYTDGVLYIDNHLIDVDTSKFGKFTVKDSTKSIASNTFENCELITSVILPEGFKSISSYAFKNCTSLTSITIPESLTNIGDAAFEGCSALKKVNITDLAAWCNIDFYDYGSNPLYYSKNLYLNGELATDIEIPNVVVRIKKFAFKNCTSLNSVIIPDSVTNIDNSAFIDCNLMKNITIGTGVESIGVNVFKGCSALETVDITDLESWCNIDFSNEYSSPLYYAKNLYIDGKLSTDVVIPNSVEKINRYAFYGSRSIKSITIPGSIKVINSNIFSYSDTLNSIILCDGVEEISTYAFSNCSALTSITIPNSVRYVKEYAFNNCTKLNSIIIPNSVTTICSNAFYGCTSLSSINIPENLTNIEASAFAKCSSLSSVYVDSISKWCSMSFENAYTNPIQYSGGKIYVDNVLLTDLYLPKDIESIGVNQFFGCNSIKSVYIPKNILLINKNAFSYCNNIKNVYYEGTEEEWEEVAILAGNDKILNANIFFNSESIPVAVESVEITKLPTKTEYIQNREALDLSGGYITVYYDNGTTQNVYLSTLNVTGFDNSVLGEQTLTVKYSDFTAEFTVTIIERPAEFIALLKLPLKLKYNYGEALDLTGGEIAVGYSDGTFEFKPIVNDMVSGFDNTPGLKVLKITHGGKQTELPVLMFRNPDLDGNGTVSATDVAVLKKSLLSSNKQEDHDLNVDGSVNVLDLVHIKKVVSK